MSEYQWSDPEPWDEFAYVKKGDKKLGFCETYLELEDLQRQLEVYQNIAEEAIEVTPDHFDEGYGWSESIAKLKEQG